MFVAKLYKVHHSVEDRRRPPLKDTLDLLEITKSAGAASLATHLDGIADAQDGLDDKRSLERVAAREVLGAIRLLEQYFSSRDSLGFLIFGEACSRLGYPQQLADEFLDLSLEVRRCFKAA